MKKTSRMIATGLMAIIMLLIVLGLVFRTFIYNKIPVTPGEPMGAGDVAELLIFYGLAMMAATGVAFSLFMLIIPAWRDLKTAIGLLVAGGASVPLYLVIHAMI